MGKLFADYSEEIRLYAEGWSIARIAKRRGVGSTAIKIAFGLRGIETLRYPRHTTLRADYSEEIRLYRLGWGLRQVADYRGVSLRSLRKAFKLRKVRMRRTKPDKRKTAIGE